MKLLIGFLSLFVMQSGFTMERNDSQQIENNIKNSISNLIQETDSIKNNLQIALKTGRFGNKDLIGMIERLKDINEMQSLYDCLKEIIESNWIDYEEFNRTEKVFYVSASDDSAVQDCIDEMIDGQNVEENFNTIETFMKKWINEMLKMKMHNSKDLLRFVEGLNAYNRTKSYYKKLEKLVDKNQSC